MHCLPGGGGDLRAVKARIALDTSGPAAPPTWEGWGTSLCWFAHAVGHDTAACDAICALLFSRQPAALGFNIVRYNIGGANQQHVDEYRAGAAVPCFARPDGTKDWSVDAGQVAMLLKAAQLGGAHMMFEAFVNSPPWFMTKSGTSRGHKLPLKNNLRRERITDFAQYCADVVEYFRAVRGIEFTSLSPFNEPASPAWCLAVNCKQEACYFSKRRSHKVLRALLQQPALRGTQLVAFEQFCVRDTLSDLQRLPKQLRPAVARVNTHTYTSATFFGDKAGKPLVLLQDNGLARRRLRRLLQRWGGTPLWVSEFGTGRGPLQLAQQVVRDLATLLPSAWVYWQAVEGLGAGWGLLEAPLTHPPPPPPSPGPVAAAGSVSSGGAAVNGGSSGAAAAAPVRAANGGSGSGEQRVRQLVVHPNYWVMHFLVGAVPVGSRLWQVQGLGSCGLAVQQPSVEQQHWVLLYVNGNSGGRAASLQVDLASLRAAAAADACGCSGSVTSNTPCTADLRLLDVGALRAATVDVDEVTSASGASVVLAEGCPSLRSGEVVVQQVSDGSAIEQVAFTVPAGCLARLDVRW